MIEQFFHIIHNGQKRDFFYLNTVGLQLKFDYHSILLHPFYRYNLPSIQNMSIRLKDLRS